MVNFSTLVRGDGIAARCCEFLLQQTTMPVGVERESRVPIPALLLGDAALALLRDVFQQPDLLEDAWKIQKRIVAWNPSMEPVELPHSAVVVSERALLEQVVSGPHATVAADGGMTIYSGRQLPAGLVNHAFGRRMASSAAVVLAPEMASEICAIEAVVGGWLFLVPTSRESGWLLTVGGGADSLLGESR